MKESKVENFKKILSAFKINYENITIDENKFFDTYNIRLELGCKYLKLEKILPDIGLALSSYNIPNGHLSTKDGLYKIDVQKAEIISKDFLELYTLKNDYFSPIILGTNKNGEPLIIDLQTLPNLLLGGIPGSGKSVLLHSIILSLIAKSNLYLVDPKQVEFGIYGKLSNVTIVNSLQEFSDLLETVTEIMESRFSLLSSYGFRNVQEYNLKKPPQKSLTALVIVIDEWADLYLQNNKIQNSLCYVAQKGRAAGISIVMATQRPSANIISGQVKANFSGRIALKVASSIDSRVILDQKGAENIQNIAEGLYLDQNLISPQVFKVPFIKEPNKYISTIPDIKSKMSFWKKLWL